ncbi:MAG: Myo-inosose-2 dehydratase, partial [Bacteroidota bacterium]
MNRRHFIQSSAGLAGLAILPNWGNSSIKLGYSSITWGGKDLQAIQEIASLGFKGIQLRANTYPIYKDKPQELKAALDQAGLTLAM